jgi:conjugal transfer pilus assembly protein TraF
MSKIAAVLITCLMFCTQTAYSADGSAGTSSLDYQSVFACGDNSKFNWYCDASEQPKQVKKPILQKDKEQAAIDEMEAISKDLKAKRDLAILEPTPENVKSYIEAQEVVMNRASTFSDVWRRVIWQNPDVNYELKRPANNAAIKTFDDMHQAAEVQTTNSFGKDWGLFFFFRSDCPYCHRMAPMLKMFSSTYNLAILPISEDGGGLPEFPNPQVDKAGVAKQLGLDVVPALVLGNVKDHRMIPIASGMVSAQDILQRIYVLTQTKPGQSY